MTITVVFNVVSCESGQNAPTVVSERTQCSEAHCYGLHQSPKARKNADNLLIRGLWSFKVTDFGTNRTLVVDFSLALRAERKYVEIGLC